MPSVRINPIKNRLYITFGDWDQAEMAAYVQNIEDACKILAPGFTCLLVSQTKGMIRQKDKDLLFNTTDLISAYGAGRVAYVGKTNESRLNPIYFQTFNPVEHAPSTKDAEEILDGKAPRIKSLKPYVFEKNRTRLGRN